MAAMDNIFHPSLSVASLSNAGQNSPIGRSLNVNGLKLARLRGMAVNVTVSTCWYSCRREKVQEELR